MLDKAAQNLAKCFQTTLAIRSPSAVAAGLFLKAGGPEEAVPSALLSRSLFHICWVSSSATPRRRTRVHSNHCAVMFGSDLREEVSEVKASISELNELIRHRRLVG